ncbi:MAG: SNF2 helicase associated domain-containing protein [Myxococcaceae bacterium]|nr:SNF2 helicase associated domain-containing protein [Myxococcaceae bacterium]
MSQTPPPSPQPPDDAEWIRYLKLVVQPTTFKKGRELAETRRVTMLAREGRNIVATVLGSEGDPYQVALWREGEKVGSTCTCPAHNQYGPHCKHVVAAGLLYRARIRAIRARNGEIVAVGTSHQNEAAGQNAANDLTGSPPSDAEDARASEGAGDPPPGSRGDDPLVLPALAKLENWLGLSAIPDHEFLYRLTPAHGATGGRHWIVDVRRIDQQAKGPINVKRFLQAGARISPPDERVFLELARHEVRFDARVVLSDEDVANLVDVLRQRRVIYRGTALVFADEPARPQISLQTKEGSSVARIEVALPDGATLALKDVIFLPGRRTWVIAGQTLYPLDPDFPPRLLRKWLLEPAMAFPESQVDRILTFFAAHLPRFRLSLRAEGIDVDDTATPKFVLTLEGTAEKVKAKLGARYGTTTVQVSPDARHLGYASGSDGKSRKLYRRREDEERAAARRLIEAGFRFDSATATYEAQGDAAIAFWAETLKALPQDWEVFTAAPPKVRVRPKLKPRVKVTMGGVNWFELDASFVTDEQQVDLGAVRMWLDSGRRYIALKDGTWAEADREQVKRAADLLEEAGALPGRQKTRLPLYQAAALGMLADLDENFEIEAKARRAIRELQGAHGIPAVDAPAGLQATLRHYQEAGLSWLWFLHRHGLSGILADDMGLGKTVQALSLLLKVHQEEGHKPSLVVAPTSVLANWEREAQRFVPGLKTMIWHGQDRKEKVEQLKSMDVVLTSYALVRRDVAELSEVGFRYVILDEAQNIKNADSATAQACKALPSEQRLALTGTPLENRLSELWSIFDFLMPGFLGSASTFSERYEQPIQVVGDQAARERLRRRIQPFILRRLKTEVAKDLPPKTEAVAWCEMEPGQAALYREVLEESKKKVYEQIDKVGFKRSRVSILAALMRLRQVCCDPRLLKLPPGTLLPPSAKLGRFMELLDELIGEGHRALVFSQFVEMLELLKQAADEKGIRYLYLDGRTRDRMARVDEFNDPNGPPVFFISLKAGGTGLNLTAADYVIHFDPWWNPAVEDQATDRTHRIGQTKAVISYKLITRNTVEEKILQLQQRKRELAAGVLTSDDAVARTLTEQDVAELFEMPDLV